MTAPAPTRPDFAALDARITEALRALRRARAAARTSPAVEAVQAMLRAEQELDALLDYRCSSQRRARTPGSTAEAIR